MRIFGLQSSTLSYLAATCLNIGSYCALCSRPGQPGIDLCLSCSQLFRKRLHTDRSGCSSILCLVCGQPTRMSACALSLLPSACAGSIADSGQSSLLAGDICSRCVRSSSPLLHWTVAPYRYAYPLDGMIKRIKYGHDRQLTRVCGTLLAHAVNETLPRDLPELLVPMPLHPGRLASRGFNQSLDIARWCGRSLGVRVCARSAQRIVDTGSLAGLTRDERQHRIVGAFRASDTLYGRRVAIVDDVLTTGASARELAREIYDCGATSVELWVLARTSSRRTGV